MSMEMKAGETKRFTCEECSVEFDLIYEPKCAGANATARDAAAATEPEDVTTCPFCGAALADEDEEGDDSDVE